MPAGEHGKTQPRAKGGGFGKMKGRRAHVPYQEQAKKAKEELKKATDDYETELWRLQTDNARSTRELTTAHIFELARLRADQAAELADLKAEHAAELAYMKAVTGRATRDECEELRESCDCYKAAIADRDSEIL